MKTSNLAGNAARFTVPRNDTQEIFAAEGRGGRGQVGGTDRAHAGQIDPDWMAAMPDGVADGFPSLHFAPGRVNYLQSSGTVDSALREVRFPGLEQIQSRAAPQRGCGHP